jgi:hypothetical protein
MSTVNIYKAVWHNPLGHQNANLGETSLVAAALNASATALAALIKSNHTYISPFGSGKDTNRTVTVDNMEVLHHNVLSTGATGACALYRVTWHNSRMNAANTQTNDLLILAPKNTQAGAFASTIQTANGDGQTVTVDRSDVVLPEVIA